MRPNESMKLISGGINLYPREIEEVLQTHPDVADAVVVGAPDPHWGERVVAFVRTREGRLDAARLEAHCRTHLAAFKVPKEFRAVDEIPRNPTGKLLRRVLRDQIE